MVTDDRCRNLIAEETTDRVLTDVETTGVLTRRIKSRGLITLDGLEEQRGLFSSHVVFMHDFEMHQDHEPPEEGDELKFFDVSCVQPFDDVSDTALLQMLSVILLGYRATDITNTTEKPGGNCLATQ